MTGVTPLANESPEGVAFRGAMAMAMNFGYAYRLATVRAIVDECLKRRLLINCTHGNVLRLLPALNLPDDALQAGCDILESVLLSSQPV